MNNNIIGSETCDIAGFYFNIVHFHFNITGFHLDFRVNLYDIAGFHLNFAGFHLEFGVILYDNAGFYLSIAGFYLDVVGFHLMAIWDERIVETSSALSLHNALSLQIIHVDRVFQLFSHSTRPFINFKKGLQIPGKKSAECMPAAGWHAFSTSAASFCIS